MRLLKEILGIPDEYRIVTVVFFGYKGNIDDLDEQSKKKELKTFSRKPLSEIVHYDGW